jgi:hypothetical protein
MNSGIFVRKRCAQKFAYQENFDPGRDIAIQSVCISYSQANEHYVTTYVRC